MRIYTLFEPIISVYRILIASTSECTNSQTFQIAAPREQCILLYYSLTLFVLVAFNFMNIFKRFMYACPITYAAM